MIKTIKILGYNYKIKETESVKDGGMDDAGRAIIDQQVILVPKFHNHQGNISTILHEVIEVLNYHFAWNLPHDVIMQLEAGLFAVLQDNPDVFRKEQNGKQNSD
jgi:hypothetical protein